MHKTEPSGHHFFASNHRPKRRHVIFKHENRIRGVGMCFWTQKLASELSENSFEAGKWNPRRRKVIFLLEIRIRSLGKQFRKKKKEYDNSEGFSIIFLYVCRSYF